MLRVHVCIAWIVGASGSCKPLHCVLRLTLPCNITLYVSLQLPPASTHPACAPSCYFVVALPIVVSGSVRDGHLFENHEQKNVFVDDDYSKFQAVAAGNELQLQAQLDKDPAIFTNKSLPLRQWDESQVRIVTIIHIVESEWQVMSHRAIDRPTRGLTWSHRAIEQATATLMVASVHWG